MILFAPWFPKGKMTERGNGTERGNRQETEGESKKQVTRRQNIADRWAGACNPHPYLPPLHAHFHTDNSNCSIINARFHTIRLDHHGPTDRPKLD